MGVVIAQLAVFAAARRAGRIPPADALREVAIEHPRPSAVRVLAGATCLAGGAAMSILFSGYWAMVFAVLGGILLAMGTGLLGRWLLGLPAAALAAPLRRFGASGLLASTGLAANRWRTAALATPIMLVAMLAGTQGIVESSNQRHVEDVTRARTTAAHVVVGEGGAPLPAGAAATIGRLGGVDAVTAVEPTEVYPLAGKLGEQGRLPAAGRGSPAPHARPRDGRGRVARRPGRGVAAAASSRGLAASTSATPSPSGWPTSPATLRVVAIYDRAAGLGDVLLGPGIARRHAAGAVGSVLFVAGGVVARRSLARYASDHPEVQALSRGEYLGTVRAAGADGAWGVWLVVGLGTALAVLALINTAAMTTTERRGELATIRLLGGTSGHVTRMVMLETVPTVIAALGTGAAIVAVAVAGVPRGLTGFPLVVPPELAGGLAIGAAVLGLLTAAVTTRIALRASPAVALRGAG